MAIPSTARILGRAHKWWRLIGCWMPPQSISCQRCFFYQCAGLWYVLCATCTHYEVAQHLYFRMSKCLGHQMRERASASAWLSCVRHVSYRFPPVQSTYSSFVPYFGPAWTESSVAPLPCCRHSTNWRCYQHGMKPHGVACSTTCIADWRSEAAKCEQVLAIETLVGHAQTTWF